ncbi:MAG: DUF4129 domain-containing protein [Pirellulaceae bacterium]|nr:DUF4129 domain-containing protein [Planctomycetaceae bacterium]MDG1809567.1 DUF4129 domain-containing protein [Pirellulaceae bacterium]MDG2104515.1 DUF4129 domain-containing protein [Pirellulaceae bacterium]
MSEHPSADSNSIKKMGGIALQFAGPALTMLVVSSMAFFLVEIFYSGPFVGRVKWILTLFCFAAVLISRISIEEGFHRASGFGLILGVATLVVTSRLMQGNPIALAGIIAFVWWAAGRLTWDCTFIDESRDATGQGMIDLAIIRFNRFRGVASDAMTHSNNGVGAEETDAAESANKNPWELFVDVFWKRKQANTPGLWAFYFLLMGLPLFGLGQLMLSMTDDTAHRAAASHFFFYVVGLLGLLMLSSVLGMHRYLQSNQSAMPANIAKRWIIAGTILAIGITGFCFMLPRPTAQYSVGNWLPKLTSQFTSPSQQSMGNDGQKKGENNNQSGGPDSRQAESEQDQDNEQGSGGNEQKSEQGETRDTEGGENAGGESQGKQGSGGKQKGESKSSSKSSKSKKGKQGRKSSDKSKSNSKNSQSKKNDPNSKSSQQKEQNVKSNKQSRQQKKSSKGRGSQRQSRSSRRNQNQSKKSNQQNSTPSNVGSFLGSLFRYMVLITCFLAILWFGFKHRAQILPWIRSFLAELADFWNRLWNRKPKPKPTPLPKALTPTAKKVDLPGFSKYSDPFGNQNAEQWSPERIVKYTFEALEAWARDLNCERKPDETALEFADAIAANQPSLKKEAVHLANLYSRLAYAGGTALATRGKSNTIDRAAIHPLAKFWGQLAALYSQPTTKQTDTSPTS